MPFSRPQFVYVQSLDEVRPPPRCFTMSPVASTNAGLRTLSCL